MTLATDGVIGANGGPRSPGTAYILLHHCMGGVAGIAGCGASCAAAWARCPKPSPLRRASHGAEIRTERAGGARAGARRAARAAWCLRAARRSKSPMVASNLDPKLTFLRLVDARELSTRNSSTRSADSASEGHVAQDQPGALRAARVPRPARRARARSIAPPCTSARPSSTWSAPGTTPSTAARPSGRCSN